MRNICNINFASNDGWGVMNSVSDIHSVMISILPMDNQKSNYRIEITRPNNTVITSNSLTPNGNTIDYVVSYDYWKLLGTMKLRLISNEGNSPYVLFDSLSAFTKTDDVIVKLKDKKFTITKRVSQGVIDVDMIYPIGAVITNSKSTFNPNVLYQGTTWTRIKGRVIVGLDENDNSFSMVDREGGSKTSATASTTLLISQIPNHTHAQHIGTASGGSISVNADYSSYSNSGNSVFQGIYTEGTGGGQPHNHGSVSTLQPYIVKYVWERIS